MVKKAKIKVTTTGSAGSATGSATTQETVEGEIVRIAVNYHGSAPATTDVTIAEVNEEVSQTILNLANQNTDINVYPQHVLDQNDGTDLTYDGTRKVYGPFHVSDEITVSVAQCDALTDAVVVDIYYEE